MLMRFHGAAGTVTGSMFEFRDPLRGHHFLVDAGSFVGETNSDQLPPDLDARSLQFVLLTHAHTDHIGRLPLLHRAGFRGPIYCTPETAELARIQLRDGLKFSGAAYEKANVDGLRFEPRFDRYCSYSTLLTGLHVQALRSSHLLGAVTFQLNWGEGTINPSVIVSGDLGSNIEGSSEMPLEAHGHFPLTPPSNSQTTMLLESTYGAEERPTLDAAARREALSRELRTCIERGGKLIIPAFATQRTQAILFDLAFIRATEPHLAALPILLASPLGAEVNRVYCQFYGRSQVRKTRDGAVQKYANVNAREMERLQLAEGETALFIEMVAVALGGRRVPREWADHPNPIVRNWRCPFSTAASISELPASCVVIASGGMGSGGTSEPLLRAHLSDAKTTVCFAGYCAAGTAGARLLEIASFTPQERSTLPGTLWPESTEAKPLPLSTVRAEIRRLNGYSAHAPASTLERFVFNARTRKDGKEDRCVTADRVFLVHGENRARQAVRDRLQARANAWAAEGTPRAPSIQFELPERTSAWFDLDTGNWTTGDASAETIRLEAIRLLERCDIDGARLLLDRVRPLRSLPG